MGSILGSPYFGKLPNTYRHMASSVAPYFCMRGVLRERPCKRGAIGNTPFKRDSDFERGPTKYQVDYMVARTFMDIMNVLNRIHLIFIVFSIQSTTIGGNDNSAVVPTTLNP